MDDTYQAITRHETRAAARKFLRAAGFSLASISRIASDRRVHRREYWAYADGKPETLVDHSASLTRVGRDYMVSIFPRDAGARP